jgi:hypothetical protein
LIICRGRHDTLEYSLLREVFKSGMPSLLYSKSDSSYLNPSSFMTDKCGGTSKIVVDARAPPLEGHTMLSDPDRGSSRLSPMPLPDSLEVAW